MKTVQKRKLTVRLAVAASAACMVCMGAGQDDAWMASIRRDHPRMFFNAETWPQVKARAEGPARAARDAAWCRISRPPSASAACRKPKSRTQSTRSASSVSR